MFWKQLSWSEIFRCKHISGHSQEQLSVRGKVIKAKPWLTFASLLFSLRNFIQDVHRYWLTWYVSWVHKLYPIIAVTLKICFLFCLICICWLQCSLGVQVFVIVCAVFAPYVSYGSWCIHNPTDVESQCAEDKPSRERFLSLVAASVVCFGPWLSAWPMTANLSLIICMKIMQF